jgi:transcription antitermination factor NusG
MMAQAAARAAHHAPDAASGWYVIRTAPGLVRDLIDTAAQVGAQVYTPMYPRRVRPSRARRQRIERTPAFPGYAFVRVDDAPLLRLMPGGLHERFQFLRAAGMSGGQAFVRVPAGTIDWIAQKAEAEWHQYEVEAKPIDRFAVGDRVRIAGDPFGIVWTVSARRSGYLSLESLGATYAWAAKPDLCHHVAVGA